MVKQTNKIKKGKALHKNPHDFKYAKKNVLKKYAAKRGLRKGTDSYNAYVHGAVAHRMAGKYKARKG